MRLAQKSIPTGLVYKQNEEVLEEVGVAPLQKMLEKRDWAGLEGKKVRTDKQGYTCLACMGESGEMRLYR